MASDAEEKVKKFYNTIGWQTEGKITEDARRSEDLRENAKQYVSKCRLRVLKYIPSNGENILDMASGPIQYKEYLEYSRNFKKRYCIDLSKKALDDAKKKIGNHGVFLCGSFFNIFLKENFFDCAISLHTIYHIDKDKQEEAVRKLIRVTKPGSPVIIVYSNPHTIIRYFLLPLHLLRIIKKLLGKIKKDKEKEPYLYFFAHPIRWWDRFRNLADIQILPWRSFGSSHQKGLIPNNKFGKKMFNILFNIEEKFPDFFVKYFQYPMIVLMKRKNNNSMD
jgi:ubiquinone/menaquinone biosynthesis C-methylase UbiE